MAAAARAAHRIVDRPPFILDDPLAVRMLGERADELIDYHRMHGAHPVLSVARAEVTTRSRFTEDRVAASGFDQYVVLGAGLDTFAHRAAGSRVAVFEVDQPETQEYKKSVAPAGAVNYVPVDFETDDLLERLVKGGFDPARPAVVGWLGVALYLDLPDIERTLGQVATFAPGSELVAEHMLPAGRRDAAGDAFVAAVEPVVLESGERWRSLLSTEDIADLLRRNGFGTVRSVSQREAVPSRLWARSDGLVPGRVSALAHAVVG
jgi:methyltransferase (TIGR00027 family)